MTLRVNSDWNEWSSSLLTLCWCKAEASPPLGNWANQLYLQLFSSVVGVLLALTDRETTWALPSKAADARLYSSNKRCTPISDYPTHGFISTDTRYKIAGKLWEIHSNRYDCWCIIYSSFFCLPEIFLHEWHLKCLLHYQRKPYWSFRKNNYSGWIKQGWDKEGFLFNEKNNFFGISELCAISA